MSNTQSTTRAKSARGLLASAAGVALAAALLAGVAMPAHANNFPFSQGPSGFDPNNNSLTTDWSYWERPGIPTSEFLLTTNGVMFKICRFNSTCPPGSPANTPGWDDPSAPNLVPAFFGHNNLILWWSRGGCCTPVPLPGRSVFMHPGAGGRKAELSFLVPPKLGGGSYISARIKAQITDVDTNGGDGVSWTIEHQVGVTYTPIASGTLLSNSSSLSFSFPVTTGDRINFVVDANANEFFDLTALTGKIELN